MNLITLLKNITVHLIRLDATALINPLSQQFNKLLRNLNSLNTTTGKLTTPTQKNSCKLRKIRTYRRQPLLAQLLLILSSFVLIVMTSCAPSSDTAAPPDNPTLLANLIKESNLSKISGLTVTADNSDPANPKLTITGITNNSNTAPVTATITIDQSKGITTDPASFTVTAESPISPYSTDTALTVTFEGEAAVSYTVTTQISGAAVGDWIVNEKLSEYITVSFGGQSGNLSVADRIFSITGLTNIPTGTGEITFTLPTGFTSDRERIEIPNPAGTNTATSTPNPNTFTITETDNTGNSETYTIGTINLAKLTRFTPGIHIKVAEGGTDITSSLTITEENNNTIRIAGLRNKLGANQYTLTIEPVSNFFTTPASNSTISRTITEPTVDISAGTGDFSAGTGTVTPSDTFGLTNSLESTATEYTLIVEFSAAAPSDWFTAARLSTYITASFGGESGTLTLDGTNLLLSGGTNFTNVPDGMVVLTVGALPIGYELSGAAALTDPGGPGLAAVDARPIGTITITETNNPANTQDYPVTITLKAYKSPLTADNITATYGGASPSDITIDTNMITISGFTNKDGGLPGGVTVDPIPAGYTITLEPDPLTISDPTGENSTNTNIGTIIVTKMSTGKPVSHPVTVNFFGKIQLSITGNDVTDDTEVDSGDTITLSTTVNACQLLTPPTVSVVGVSGSKVAAETPFPLYYDRERDTSNTMGFSVTRRLSLKASDGTLLSTGFEITLNHFPACDSFAGSGDGTSSSPYEIDNAPRLELASHLVNTEASYRSSHYKITANINMGLPGLPLSEVGSGHPNEMGTTGKGFLPIGRNFPTNFSGTFDCSSNTISGLYINRPGEARIGLLGSVIGGTVQNCFMTDVNIRGSEYVGGLVGYASQSTISLSYTTGSVKGVFTSGSSGSGERVGGLVGTSDGAMGTVINSYATSSVSGLGGLGGLAGELVFGSSIENSYATGSVTSMGKNNGGLVGLTSPGLSADSIISNSYATGFVSGVGNTGGLVGHNRAGSSYNVEIINSYAIGNVSRISSTESRVGLFIGFNDDGAVLANTSGVTDSYYNTDAVLSINDAPITAKGVGSDTDSVMTANLTGLSTALLQVAKGTASGGTYFTWIDSIWNFTDGQYPRLKNVVCANRQYNQDATECTDL